MSPSNLLAFRLFLSSDVSVNARLDPHQPRAHKTVLHLLTDTWRACRPSLVAYHLPSSNNPIVTFASKDRTREAEPSDARNASNDRLERLRQPCRSAPSSRSTPYGGWFSLAAFLFACTSAGRCEQTLHVFAYPERVCAISDGFRSLVFRHVPHFCVCAG